jgi:Ser-tRNA(Ala) deacylase AlaX
MTDKVFWREPYRDSLQAVVSSVNGLDVTLESTIFYAFSGGQERDEGTIDRVKVVQAETVGEDIVYTLEGPPAFAPGDTVEVAIDWDRRYRLMRLHLAAEIVLVLAMRHVPGIERIGAHISEDKARLDFALPEPVTKWLSGLETGANELISADHPVISGFSDAERRRRYWEIEGFGSMPCAGTHIRRTGEIGPIRLSRKNPGKGKERIEIIAAARA